MAFDRTILTAAQCNGPPCSMAKKQRIPKEKPAPADSTDTGAATAPIDPRLLIIARAIGRLIAREQLNAAKIDGDS